MIDLILEGYENVDHNLDYETDYNIILNGFTGCANIRGGRIVQVIGQQMESRPQDASSNFPSALRFRSNNGVVKIKDCFIDASNLLGGDCINGGKEGHTNTLGSFQFENSVLIGGRNNPAQPQFHSDCFQPWGDIINVTARKTDFYCNVQGLFLDPQHNVQSITLDHVSIVYHEQQEGYALYIDSLNENNKPKPLITLHEVYVSERANPYPESTPQIESWPQYSVYPPLNLGSEYDRNKMEISFPMLPNVSGVVKKWNGQQFAKLN